MSKKLKKEELKILARLKEIKKIRAKIEKTLKSFPKDELFVVLMKDLSSVMVCLEKEGAELYAKTNDISRDEIWRCRTDVLLNKMRKTEGRFNYLLHCPFDRQ